VRSTGALEKPLPPSSGWKGEAAACTKVSVPVHHAVGFTSLKTEILNTF
jgi:hypothetical protein